MGNDFETKGVPEVAKIRLLSLLLIWNLLVAVIYNTPSVYLRKGLGTIATNHPGTA
jgi:hypothetical protein